MRLKCIKLAGFKSFVDPTTIPFPSNMCGIVGPNGCGKSNTIDAVKWVMGESSAKNLRGDSMTDVIFNGSNSRKPVNQAFIELVFDNSDGTLLGEYAGYAEISVKRRVTRDGQSQYFLNGTKCRRRDITDLFMGTGLGPRSYAIIEQGMISRFVEAKPEELRTFIEEAAGISRYKDRRRDTENRMRRTHENLERLTDLRDELERQLEHLKKQAESAEKYKNLKSEERKTKTELLTLRWQDLDNQVKEKEKLIQDLEVRFEAALAGQRSFDADIEEKRLAHTEASDQFNEVQGLFYQLGSQIARTEQSIEHQNERAVKLERDLNDVKLQLAEGLRELEQEKEQRAILQDELDEIEPELEMLSQEREESSLMLEEAEEARQQWQQRWDQYMAEASQPEKEAEVQQTKIRQFEENIDRHIRKQKRLQEEQDSLVIGSAEAEIESLKDDLLIQEDKIEQQQMSIQAANEEISSQQESIEQKRKQVANFQAELQSAKGRFASLEALQQSALGDGNEVIDRWLKNNGLFDRPRLAKCLTVHGGWDLAVETVLGDFLQAVTTAQQTVNQQIASFFEQGCEDGALSIITQGTTAGSNSSAPSALSALIPIQSVVEVEGSIDLGGLLDQVYLAENLAQALPLQASLPAGHSIVTKDGVWLGANWLRVSGNDAGKSGIIGRQKELEYLEERIDELDFSVEDTEIELESTRLQLKSKEQNKDFAQKELMRLERQLSELQSEMNAKRVRVEQVLVRKERIDAEIEEVSEQIEFDRESLADAKILWQEALELAESNIVVREQLEREKEQTQQQLESVRSRSQSISVKYQDIRLKVESLRTQNQSVHTAIGRMEQQVERLRERNELLNAELEETSDPGEELRLQLEEMIEQRLDVEAQLTQARKVMEELDHSVSELERLRNEAEHSSQGVRTTLENHRMEWQALQVRRNGLKEQLDELKVDLENQLTLLPEGISEAGWEEELRLIQARIQRLGAINLAAIDEYQSQSERKRYLDMQNEDLTTALETLESAIRKIDRETKARFKDTFDKINAGLGELFPKVFGGGHAYLELTDDDLLTTGVAIMARPPGKKNSTIHLLSGGEKALTAIAMVFSIFQLNPAPFCMLDEVDAPLDDANVSRYANLVKEMSSKVQFIYITHNKIAMEKAEQLLGVTMQEPGCSRLVSVDVEAAAAMIDS
ncbi:chromosome segregation protein SMC [Litoribacillus peritrichatus]|uniref:Chromosome partition protein Smc n=1 Tax=Litoribacillus peritrichatus TaxID=718191 RepID=A0ABP7M8Y0_9GAMM